MAQEILDTLLQMRTRAEPRITSYNVCYTKLLRVMREQLVREGQKEAGHISWNRAATKVASLYNRVFSWFKMKMA